MLQRHRLHEILHAIHHELDAEEGSSFTPLRLPVGKGRQGVGAPLLPPPVAIGVRQRDKRYALPPGYTAEMLAEGTPAHPSFYYRLTVVAL